jgi:NADH:ubiquinone oxidoreductase subunit 6 (subunit J)
MMKKMNSILVLAAFMTLYIGYGTVDAVLRGNYWLAFILAVMTLVCAIITAIIFFKGEK